MKKVFLAVLSLVFAIWCLWGLFIIGQMAYDCVFSMAKIGKNFPQELFCWVGVFPVYAVCLGGVISYSERQRRKSPRRLK